LQSANNSKEQFNSSPDLRTALRNVIMMHGMLVN